MHSTCYKTFIIMCFKLKFYLCADNDLVNKWKIWLFKAFRVILGWSLWILKYIKMYIFGLVFILCFLKLLAGKECPFLKPRCCSDRKLSKSLTFTQKVIFQISLMMLIECWLVYSFFCLSCLSEADLSYVESIGLNNVFLA